MRIFVACFMRPKCISANQTRANSYEGWTRKSLKIKGSKKNARGADEMLGMILKGNGTPIMKVNAAELRKRTERDPAEEKLFLRNSKYNAPS
jgi:hypothetical protein